MTPPLNPAAGAVLITREMMDAGAKAIADERKRVGLQYPDTLAVLAYQAMALLSAAAPASVDAVAVKALEWVNYEAASPTGTYRVQRLDDKWEPLRNSYYMLPRIYGVVEAFGAPEEAMAFCQADYEQRIRSALTPTVTSGAGAGGFDICSVCGGAGESPDGCMCRVCGGGGRAAKGGDVREAPETRGPYEARLCKDIPSSCCDYGVISLSEGREVCRVWREQDARAIAAALSTSAAEPLARGADYAGDITPHDDKERGLAVIRDAYDFDIADDGTLCGLVAGDQGWASTHIRIVSPPAPAAVESAQGWQDINTAPKDWTDVLLYAEDRERKVFEGYYDATAERWRSAQNEAVTPSLWRPLPAPPRASLAAEKEG